MAEQSTLPAGVLGHHTITSLEDDSTIHEGTQDAVASDEHYKPLPPGCWTLPFHGNCPRCRHHHRAAEVQVKVSEDPSQVSYVYCEKCREKWAAFGGRNTTRISLLSTTTTEPDSTDRLLRAKLIEIIGKAVAAKATLGTVTESPSPGVSRTPSETASISANPPDEAVTSVPFERDIVEVDHDRHESLEMTPVTSGEHTKPLKRRDRTVQLFSKLKVKLTSQLSRLRRVHLKLQGSNQQPLQPTGQSKQSPTRPHASKRNAVPEDHPIAIAPTQSVPEDKPADVVVDKPAEQFADVVTFLTQLDKAKLSSLDDQGQAKWVREAYTDFKNRKKLSLRCSSITETSIAPLTPPLPLNFNRRSNDVLFAGAHIDGLRDIAPFLRRHSIAMSEGASERLSILDGSTVVALTRIPVATAGQQPQFDPAPEPSVTDRSSITSHRRSRHSLELHLHRRGLSLTSLRGNVGSRLSQGSMTAYDSMTNIHETLSRYDERRPWSPESSFQRPTSS